MSIELPVIQPGLVVGEIFLDKKKVEVNPMSPISFTCESRVDCCSTMQIPASEYDIQHIMDNGYELDQIIKDPSPIILNPNSSVGPSHKAYILKTKPFDGSCTFLEDKLCKIHKFKPFACKLYPFALDFLSDNHIRLVIHQDQLCKSIRATNLDQSNNKAILTNIMEVILNELKMRGYN